MSTIVILLVGSILRVLAMGLLIMWGSNILGASFDWWSCIALGFILDTIIYLEKDKKNIPWN
jgi:hypothetical protein